VRYAQIIVLATLVEIQAHVSMTTKLTASVVYVLEPT